MAAMEAASFHRHHHHGHGHQSQPSPRVQPAPPASPTLTNPDMILPDYDRGDSPDLDLNSRGNSHLLMWNNAQVPPGTAAAAAAANLHHMFGVTTPGSQRPDHPYGTAGPITPTTPIIYGNGTMLSDIGEVTEVESTPGKPSPQRLRRRPDSPPRAIGFGNDAALRSSPTIGMVASMGKQKSKQNLNAQRERRASCESTSTITLEDQAALFADFDDSVSVGDSVFQGDDEESMASSYVEGTASREPSRLGLPASENPDRLSTYSTTSLSRRAEQILANAKKRLTTMEGNLTRARSTLHVTSPYGSDASTPSPPFQRASTAMYSRDSGIPSPSSNSPGHNRISSDIAMRNGLPYRVSVQRSQSAMGAAGGYRQPLTLSKSDGHIREEVASESGRQLHKMGSVREAGPKALTEQELARLDELDSTPPNAKLEQFLSPTFGGAFGSDTSSVSGRSLQRSASTAQMRDIKDQMKDLKGKISSLREQARVDSIKRRSLQSLRTPSPFTHSQIDQWYAEPPSNRSSAVITEDEAPARNPWNGEETSVDGDGKRAPIGHDEDEEAEEESVYSEAENRTQLRPAAHRSSTLSFDQARALEPAFATQEAEAEEDLLTEDGDLEDGQSENFHDATDIDYESESGESFYHDTVQHPISHEDREDAFDYEHFFLHSAMGTMSQRMARRGSQDSYASEDSVETTRGPVTTYRDDASSRSGKSRSRSRRNSTASVSTIETFATADEGRSRRSAESGDVATERIFGDQDYWADNHDQYHDASAEKERAWISAETIPADSAGPAVSDSIESVSSISSITSTGTARNNDKSPSPILEESSDSHNSDRSFRSSVFRRPVSSSAVASLHRPSVSSFDSTGTNRSFPLVNRPRRDTTNGVLTPTSSPDQALKNISNRLMHETANVCEQQQQQHNGHSSKLRPDSSVSGDSRNPGVSNGDLGSTAAVVTPPALQELLREDKYLVERFMASLGKCVLGLTESGRASAESRMYRRRIDAARKILEGIDPIIDSE